MNIPDPAYLEQHKPGYATECCPSFAAGYGVHYSNCPNYDPDADAERLPAALAELDRRTLHLHVYKLVRTERLMRLERCRCGAERWEFIEP